MKTRTVKFSYGLVKDADLQVPAEAYSIVDAATLIIDSYLAWRFRPGCSLMSDEVVVSSLGQAHFFAGALGGYESRLQPEVFQALKRYASAPEPLAVATVRFRDPSLKGSAVYARAAENTELSAEVRSFLRQMSTLKLSA